MTQATLGRVERGHELVEGGGAGDGVVSAASDDTASALTS